MPTSSGPSGPLSALASAIRPPRGVVAAALIDANGDRDVFAPRSVDARFFEVGSLTKTLTATLLASMVIEGVVALETKVGDVLGPRAGTVANVTLKELATHTGGMPRLAPNAFTVPFWPRDPYRFYRERHLLAALSKTLVKDRGTFNYSNFGYMLLGYCLSKVGGQAFSELLAQRVLEPAGMTGARCQPCSSRRLLRGHGPLLLAGRRWHQPLPGAGGVDATIEDLTRWVEINLRPDATKLELAVQLAQRPHATTGERSVGLGWQITESVVWHNGATGRFQTFVAILPGQRGVAVAASCGPVKGYSLEAPVLEWLRAPDQPPLPGRDPSSE